MSAYVILDIEVTDPAGYEEYKKLAPAAVALYGGRYAARGAQAVTLEGDWAPSRLVIIEFPSIEQAKAWLISPEYAPALAMRHQYAKSRTVVIEGA